MVELVVSGSLAGAVAVGIAGVTGVAGSAVADDQGFVSVGSELTAGVGVDAAGGIINGSTVSGAGPAAAVGGAKGLTGVVEEAVAVAAGASKFIS